MHSALLLLLQLRQRAFWRRALNGVKTARGAILIAAAAAFFALMVLPNLAAPLIRAASPAMAEAQRHTMEANIPVIRTVAPLALLVFVMWSVGSSLSESAIYFTPAEVDLLFSGPFSRRQLLVYKLTQSIRGNLITGTLFSMFAA